VLERNNWPTAFVLESSGADRPLCSGRNYAQMIGY
jgi:ribosome maturation factor RimP